MIYNGRDIQIHNTTGTAIIAASKGCTVHTQADMIEVTPQSDDGEAREYRSGRTSWNVSLAWLVTALSEQLVSIGKTVQVVITLGDEAKAKALSFDGGRSPSTVQQTSLNRVPTNIYWDSTRKHFLGYYNNYYYLTWLDRSGAIDSAYISPAAGALFVDGLTYWAYTGGTLVRENGLRGTALVEEAEVTANWGSLATGSWRLRGTGTLVRL